MKTPLALLLWLPAVLFVVGRPAGAQTTIPAGTSRYDADAPGAYILNSGVTRSVASGGNEVIRIANTGTAGTYTLTINGTVSQTGSGRGIRTSVQNVTFDITIGSTGFVQGTSDDAVQGRGGPFALNNLGTLYSGPNVAATPTAPLITGRGLNLRDATGGGTITNGSVASTTALIRADGGDAVRIGSGFAFTNYGTINAAGVVNDSPDNNIFSSGNTTATYSAGAGFSFEDQDSPGLGATHSLLSNGGTIMGARHGVQAGARGSSLTVTNYTGGSIIGRNGSGVGFDTTEADPAKIIVNNYELIRGDYAGVGQVIDRTGSASPTNDGDGDGIDIDGAATINNFSTGRIIATGAGGFDSSGRANNSEGISIGGGVIINDGLIRGATRGILVNNDSAPSRSGVAAATITNNAGATIEGQSGFAIRLENKLGDARDNDTIVNAGTIAGTGSIPDPSATVFLQNGTTVDANSAGTLDGATYTGTGSARFIRGDGSAIQMGEGADVLTNTGAIASSNGRAINMEGGDDIVDFNAGTITGLIDGGTGSNTLNLGPGVTTDSAIQSFPQINVATGTATLSGPIGGTTLAKGGAGTLAVSGDNTYTGATTVTAGTLRVNNTTGSATGSGNVTVDSGATLAGAGTIAGNVLLAGILAPGNSIGVLNIDGDLTWDGTVMNAWVFELGGANASDRLTLGGSFLKGTGTIFRFDFQNSFALGAFTLVEWTNATGFVADDFSSANLPVGHQGTFAVNAGKLEVTIVPEPSTGLLILAIGAGALGCWRCRDAHASAVSP